MKKPKVVLLDVLVAYLAINLDNVRIVLLYTIILCSGSKIFAKAYITDLILLNRARVHISLASIIHKLLSIVTGASPLSLMSATCDG